MPDSYAYLGIHFIFSTKERVSLISNEIKSRLFPYIGGIIKSLNCIPIEINGMPDHIHLFCLLSREISTSDFMRVVKSKSSKWINETFKCSPKFQWQDGYGAFTVSKSSESRIIEYIKNQDEHHKKKTFQYEYVEFLKSYNIKYDEEYLWK